MRGSCSVVIRNSKLALADRNYATNETNILDFIAAHGYYGSMGAVGS